MPVTSRALQVYKVFGADKKGPTNLRWDNTKKHLVNILCDCRPPPQLPNPITVEYIVAGSYTNTLPLLPEGYVWQVTGIAVSGGGGGGGGGGGIFGGTNIFLDGDGGDRGGGIVSIPFLRVFSGGTSIPSVVGAGGIGGGEGYTGSVGLSGSVGYPSSIADILSPPSVGGQGGIGVGLGTRLGDSAFLSPGSGGAGGDGESMTSLPTPGGRGRDGRVFFTATPISE